MPTTEQIIREFYKYETGADKKEIIEDAIEALGSLETEAHPAGCNWFTLWDALGCSEERDDLQDLLYKAAGSMFALQTYYQQCIEEK